MGKPARLPKNAPKALREFVACRTTSVKLDADSLGWVPKPPGLPDSLGTKVTVKDGSTATSATLEVGFGDFISMDLPVSIGKHGELVVGGSDLPFGIGPRIDAWVVDFNNTLKENGKGLSGFEAKNGTLSITKKAIVVDEPATPATPAPKVVKPAPAPQPVPPKEKVPGGCFTWLLVAAVAFIALTTVAIIALTGSDGSDEVADLIATETADEDPVPESTAPPSTESIIANPNPVADEPPQLESLPECGTFGDGFESGDVGAWHVLQQQVQAAGECDATPGYNECSTDVLPCWIGLMPPLGITSDVPGVDHSTQIPDAVTGDLSASVSDQSLWFQGTNPGVTYLTAGGANECAGRTVSGEAPIDGNPADGVVIDVAGPLFSYGACGPPIFTIDAGPNVPMYRFPGPAESAFVVDASEPAAQPPTIDGYVQTSDRFDTSTRYLDNVNTIHNVIGGQSELDDSCMWFFPPNNVDQVVRVLDQCQSSLNHFWVFAAGVTDVEVELQVFDTVAAHTGSYVNPLGDPAASTDQLAGFDASTALFDNTIFPCGAGHVAYTACPSDAAPVESGGYVAVSGAVLGEIPLSADGTARSHTVDFAGIGGQTYTASATEAGWTLESSSGSARARAILRHDSLTFMIPRDELPVGGVSYQWSTTVDGQTVTQPVVPVMGLITTPMIPHTEAAQPDDDAPPVDTEPAEAEPAENPPDDVPEPVESLGAFYPQLSASVAAGDVGFAFDRLHPVVFEAYPTQCPAALESFADPDLVIEFVADNGPEAWTWELSDGRSIDVPDAVSVTLRLSGRGQEGTESNAHVALIDGEYHWFTLC